MKLNNEAQLLLRSAMDKTTNLSRVLELNFGYRATKIDPDAEDIPSAYHQKIYLDERYGRGDSATDQDSDQYKWEQME